MCLSLAVTYRDLGRHEDALAMQESVLEFAQAQNWQIRGFPACLVETPDGKLFGISNGFLPYEALEERIIHYLAPEV